MMEYYSYFWLREDGSPYYVGKGKNRRAYEHHGRLKPPSDLSRIVIEYYDCEKDAFEAEMFFISLFGRKDLGTGCLHNLTIGGEGVDSNTLKRCWTTAEYRIKMQNRPKINSGSFKKGYESTRKGGHREDISPEVRERMRINAKKRNDEHGNPRQGVTLSQEVKNKISKSNLGKIAYNKHSEETVKQIIELYYTGLSQQKVADKLGISQPSVSEILRRNTV